MRFGEKTAILVYMPLNRVSRCSMYSRKSLLTLATLAVNAAANPGVCYWLSMDLSASDALAFMWQPVCRVKNEPPQQYCYVEYTLIGRCVAVDDHFFIKYRSVRWALNLASEFFAIYYHTWISYHDETFSNFCLKKAPFSPKHWFDKPALPWLPWSTGFCVGCPVNWPFVLYISFALPNGKEFR